MPDTWTPRHSIPLAPDTTCVRPAEPPDWVRADDPALDVFTDFRIVTPRSVPPDIAIDDALERMKEYHVRLLLVVGEREQIVGVVSAKDIQGEKPIQLIEETRARRADLTVEQVMTPRADISVLNMISVRDARVGHILATLHALQRQHTLVVEVDPQTGRQLIVGMFSSAQIRRQMHAHGAESLPAAHSLADIVHHTG